MGQINLNNFKVITDKLNTFFVDNKFMVASEIPTTGEFKVGDIIINNGPTNVDEPMWICIEAGNPGTWTVFNSGGGSAAGSAAGRLSTARNRVVLNGESKSEVSIGVSGFNKASDVLMVFINSRFMTEGADYEINADSTKISAIGEVWNEELASEFEIEMIVFKMMGEEGVVSSVNEIVKLKNTVVVNEAVNEVEIGIDGFNEGDDLTVYRNSVYMIEGIDYEVQGNKIVSLKGAWNAEGGSDYKFTFEVLKTVAKINPDAVVGMEHLTEDVKEAIEAAGNIDLSGYATKEELNNINMSGKQDKVDNSLVTNDKSIIGAINELFQDVDSGKSIIADAIDDINISKDSTFAAMGEAIEGIHADREEDRQKLIEILQGSNMELSGNESMDTLLDLIDMSNIDLSKVVQIACGETHTFILYDNGKVYSCGKNENGQLGLGDKVARTTFTEVNIDNVRKIACGEYVTLAIKNDGSLWVTGSPARGSVGGSGIVFTQVTTNINNDVKDVVAASSHALVVKNDGSLWVCGRTFGLPGANSYESIYYEYTQITENINNDVKEISCGNEFSYILKNDGSLWACGNNDKGQCDGNSRFAKVLEDVKCVSCGCQHVVVVKNDGSVWSRGYNGNGQLGLNDNTDRTTFTQVTTNINNDVKEVICGWYQTLIIKNDGSLWACGRNNNGQLGLGDTTDRTTFTKVTANINNDVKQVSCGYYHTVILKNDGRIWTCGFNGLGQLGLGDTNDRTTLATVDVVEALKTQIQSLNVELTTNRGNLATVLTDEGVELTGDETLADLIVKVDEEFDRQVVPIEFRRGAVVECNVSVDGSKGKNNGTKYSDTISTTVTTNFGFIPSIIILYFDIGGDNVVSGDIYDLSGTLEILIDNTNVSNSLLYATSVTENSFTLVSRNARDRNDGTGDLYYYKGTVIKIYGIE